MQTATQKNVSVLIVNYNSSQYALDCIDSLNNQQGVKLQIIIVDNASHQAEITLLESALKSNVLLIKSNQNLGFAKANNLAATKATGEYFLVLNPDTKMDNIYTIKTMLEVLVHSPEIGLLAPAIHEPRKKKHVLPRYTYPSSKHLKFTKTLKNLPGKIAWVLGACMLMPQHVYKQINGFDEDYFLYGEDADICLRVRKQGYLIAYTDAVEIMHVSGASEIGADSLQKWLRKKRGVYLFFAKHYDARDVLRLAKKAVIYSKLYLALLKFKMFFLNKHKSALIDKKHRLEATIIVGSETMKNL